MTSVTPEQARESLNRWKLLGELEIDDLRSASMETKLRQLAVLMASKCLFEDGRKREGYVEELHERWSRIREALRG